MTEELKYPNTVELSSRPENVRYLWVLTTPNVETFSGLTYNGLLKAFRREGIEAKGVLPEGFTLKMVDIIGDRVIPIPASLAVEKLLAGWRRNYYNPNWTLGKK